MSQPEATTAELRGLLGRLADDAMTAPDRLRLNQLLQANPQAQQMFADYAMLGVCLEMLGLDEENSIAPVASAEDAESTGDVDHDAPFMHPSSFTTRHSPSPLPPIVIQPLPAPLSPLPSFIGSPLFSYIIAAMIVGLGLVIGAYVYVSQPEEYVGPRSPVRTPNPQSPIPSPSSIVARVTGMVDCEWETKGLGIRDWGLEKRVHGDGGIESDSPLSTLHSPLVHLGDRLALRSGLLELTYDTGARVILQGPVVYEVESPAGGYLSLGKLTAKLDKKAESPSLSTLFAVRTPTALVTDLGTEFGVEVDEKGDTTSHVYRGSVKVESDAPNHGNEKNVRILQANESARVARIDGGKNIEIRSSNVDPASFVRAGQFQTIAKAKRLVPFLRWHAYSDTLRKDPSLLAYYDFQQVPGSPAVLRNVAVNSDRSTDGIIENVAWSDGRIPGKHALQFNGVEDEYVRIRLTQKVDSLTLVAWVCPFSFNKGLNALLMSDRWGQDGQVHWQINMHGCMELGIFNTTELSPNRSALVFDAKRMFKWTELAVVYDRDAQKIRYYANGAAISESNYVSYVLIGIGQARIGHWDGRNTTTTNIPNRAFHGKIEGLAIFGRALKAEEMQRMFEAEKPAGVRHINVDSDKK